MAATFGITASYGRVNPESYRTVLQNAAAVLLNDGGEVVPISKGREAS